MVKSVYDTDDNGIVDNAAALNGQAASYYLDRTNHAGSQPSASISDFSEAVDDRVASLLVAGSGIGISYNDAGNTLTISNTGGGGGGGSTNLFALNYASNGDSNGVVSLLIGIGILQPSASGLFSGYSLNGPIDRSTGTATIENFASSNIANSWWMCIFSNGKMRVDRYTIRGKSNANSEHLRSWKLQGSQGGVTWTDLDTQSANNSINASNAYFTSGVLTNTTYWKFLRILQTGVNSSGTNFLTMNEIDFYGSYEEPA